MSMQAALEEYALALKKGQKEYRELLMSGREPHPAVLDDLLPESATEQIQDLGLVDIPSQRIVGVKTAGRITAFTASFRPLLDHKSEFGTKWVTLCKAHLGDAGITDPIECFEYLGNFYVQEGNKRVSVLRHFDAPRIPGNVKRILPTKSDDPRIKAYYEFLEFYKVSRLYTVQFRRPGDYAKLLAGMGKSISDPWTEDERRTFNSYFHYFREAFDALNTRLEDVLPEEALLLWLELYPYRELGSLPAAALKKSIAALWDDMVATSTDTVKVKTKVEEDTKGNIVTRLVSSLETIHVAFIHQLNPQRSTWVMGHEEGRAYIERVFEDRVHTTSYFDCNTPELAEAAIEEAVNKTLESGLRTGDIMEEGMTRVGCKAMGESIVKMIG